MNKIVLSGGRRLSGEVEVGGSKNAALPVLFGGIVTRGVCVFSGLPRVSDVLQALEILKHLGARIRFHASGEVRVDYRHMQYAETPAHLTAPIRASTYLLGAMLARFGRASLAASGGCDFGARPIDQHLLGFERLGATVASAPDGVTVEASNGLCGAEITLAMPSVGATANLMLAATAATGETVIRNAAAEPHVAALADFLTLCGAHITGVGTHTVHVFGGARLDGATYTVIPDMIEAGTYLCLGMACGGPVAVKNVCPDHLGALLDAFREMGGRVVCDRDRISVSADRGYACTHVETGPFPAFPTDLHPQMAALFALEHATGEGSVRETVFSDRFRYVQELAHMGAQITLSGDRACIVPHRLRGAKMRSPDLRGGAALMIAALGTRGRSEIANAATVGRGYEHLEQKLRALGAHVSVF
jgi:UDP-N-acetylglucosamine 1-carboxyvinyltransferase